MKKIAFLLFGILLFSGCWKEEVGDIIIKGAIESIGGDKKEMRSKQCAEYSTTFDWQIEKNGKILDIVKRENVIYVLKKTGYDHYELTEIDAENLEVLENIDFKVKDTGEANQNADSDINNIMFFGKEGYGDWVMAYDFVKHTILWHKERQEVNMQLIDGNLYSKSYDWENGERTFFINKIDPVTGIEQKIYTFQDSLDDLSLNEIEDINPFSDDSGHLFFAFVGLYSESINKTYVKIQVLNFNKNEINDIYSFSMDHSNLSFDCVAIDEENIYVNEKDDIFCYDRYTFENKWNSYSTNGNEGSINTIETIENYLFLGSASGMELKDKLTGETIFTKNDLYNTDKSFGLYDDVIYLTNGNFFYRIKKNGVVLDKFVSPSYCGGENSNIRFVIDKSGNIFLSDNKYIMKKEF